MSKNSFSALVQLLMSSRGFSLLIRVVIYQIVHLDESVSRMVVANFFSKSLEVKVKGQLNKNRRCMSIVAILVIMTMRCRSYNLIFQICLS